VSCEREWWDYVRSVNAHIGALHECFYRANAMLDGMTPRDARLLQYDEIHEIIDEFGVVDTTLREQRRQLEIYFEAMRRHAGYSAGVSEAF
jgi:hypothetical protein